MTLPLLDIVIPSKITSKQRKEARAIKSHQGTGNQQHGILLPFPLLCIQDHHKVLLEYFALESFYHLRYGLSESGSLYLLYLPKLDRKGASLHTFYQQFLVSHPSLPRLFPLMVLDMHRYLGYNDHGANDAPNRDYSVRPMKSQGASKAKRPRRQGMSMTSKNPNTAYTRRCSRCRLWLPFSDFPKSKWAIGGLYHACKQCTNEDGRRRYSPQKERKRMLRRRYGMTPKQYDQMLADQGGLCKICKRSETRRNNKGEITPLHVDHCHRTGDVRSLLCNNCNIALGMVGEDPELIKAFLAYAEWCQTREPNIKIIQFPLFEEEP